jgi:YVTN family beta-propeller protein
VQIGDKIHLTLVFLMILEIMVSATVVISSNNAFASTLHDKRLSEVVKQTSGLDENAQINVGDLPVSIGLSDHTSALPFISPVEIFDSLPDTVYVVNRDSNTVSVISGENNTKINDIPVGDSPVDIAFDHESETVYVANAGSDGISIIDGTDDEVVAGITLKVSPFNSGYILCDGLTTPSPTEQYFYVLDDGKNVQFAGIWGQQHALPYLPLGVYIS